MGRFKNWIGGRMQRLAPRSFEALSEVTLVREQGSPLHEELRGMRHRIAELESGAEVLRLQIEQLRVDVDEARSHSLRIAELTDLVLTRLPSGAAGEAQEPRGQA